MTDDNYFSNILGHRNIEDEEKDSLFTLNQNQDYIPDYINDLSSNDFKEKRNNNFNFIFNDNPIQYENNLFSNDIFNKDFSQLSPLTIHNQGNEDESSKQQMNINNISNISNSSSTKDRSQLKNNINKNSNSNSNNRITNNKPMLECNENSDNNDTKNKLLTNKRKPRMHLEDLELDPELIKDKKFLKIGDKVILSKNHLITEDDKKEIRALRNKISAQKSRDKKKIEFINLKMQVQYLTAELNKKILIINQYEKIVCPSCKKKIAEINNKIMEDNSENSIKISQNNNENTNEVLVLEENDSFFSKNKNPFIGKISGVLLGLVCLVGIAFCVFQSGQIINSSIFNNQKILLTSSNKDALRHLINDEICPTTTTVNEMDISDENDTKENVPLSVESFNKNNFLQMCHDKFTWEIYSQIKEKKGKKGGNFLRKRNRNLRDQISDNSVCIDTDHIANHNYSIINDSDLINNLPIEANNIILNNYLSNKIITVYVKDYEALKRFSNGRSLPLQEQIENEAKNSEDGCVYLQMIIPRETLKSNYDKNGSYSEYENEFFEIKCKIFAYNNYYQPGFSSH